MKMEIHKNACRAFGLLLTAVCLTAGIPNASAQDASTIVYVDALWCRVHAADCPDLILKDQKQTMTLGEADQLGYRIGESGQSGRTDCCLQGYDRKYPQAEIAEDAMGVLQIVGGNTKYHVHGCHRFTPNAECTRDTLANARSEPGFYLCSHCKERGPGFAQMSDEEWAKLPSGAPWIPPAGWTPSPFSTDTYPPQEEVDILLSEALHGDDAGISDRAFINPVATVDNWMIMRYFFGNWRGLYQAYRCTGDEGLLEKLRKSARHYNSHSTNYLSAAQYKARDPEGMAYMYSMAASAKITLQLARKYPAQVTAAELAEAEDFLMTIISVLEPTCEGNDNLDWRMGIPKPLADDFRSRAFNRALNGIGTIAMTATALEDLQTLKQITDYQSTIDRYRLIIQEYIKNWKNTGFMENYQGDDYFSYPYSAGDSGRWEGGVKLFGADDKGHFSISMAGTALLFESVPELGVDDAFMTAIANTIYFNMSTKSGSPQTPSQEAIRTYSRHPWSSGPSASFYMLEAFKDGTIDAQCTNLTAAAKESSLSGYESRRETFHAQYLKALSQDRTLIHIGEESVAPPAPPTGLVAIGSDESVSLDWDDNSEGDLASYSVYRSETQGSGYALVTNGLIDSDYVDSAVVNDTIYYYVVTATDTNSQVSANSSEVSAAPFVPNATPPAAPTGLTANATDGRVSLDWADNGEGDLNSYNIYRSTTSGSCGAALRAGVIPSDFVDTNVVNGTTYTYVITAVDHSSNESVQSAKISATPQAAGPTVIFGLNNDGDGGFGTSVPTRTEVWSLTADSVNYAFGVFDTDEAHTASLLKPYTLDRSDGAAYTIEGVMDLAAGYGDDNNRIGLLLFNDTSTQTSDGGGLYLRLNTEGRGITIERGINGSSFDSGNTTGAYSGDSWIGQTLTYTADLVFTNIGGTGKIDVTFTLTDGDLHTDTLAALVDAEDYTGTYFGFATKWRQRGTDDSDRNVPPVLDYKSFMVSNHTEVVADTTPPAAPTGLGATVGDDYVTLDWNDNGEGDLASYSVYRSTTSGSFGGALEAGLDLSDYVDDTAVNGTTYYYVVTATDTNGNESVQSTEVSAVPEEPALAGYYRWASNHGVGSGSADDDADGMNNFYEYAMGGDPTNAGVHGSLPVFTKSGNGFIYVHPRRSDAAGITYTVETTTNLMSGVWTNEGCFAVGTNVTGGTLDFVTNSFDIANGKKFIRLKIAQ